MKPLRPYLYHAYYHWLTDNDFTPYLLVNATYAGVDVPLEFVRDGKIILNIAPRSIGQYVVNDEGIAFNARFQGMLRDIYIPFGAAEAIYARETSDGVMFQAEPYYEETAYLARLQKASDEQTKPKPKRKSHLKLVK
ncbi:MAG: ClpXP protease specificity-enhancing factor [Pasteurellaceae bacterium]|nr:ClpXP protease specificity-enhancing factor [Pasteurellaceae bacterium]